MHLLLICTILILGLSLPPAAQVIAVSGGVFAVIQAAKRSPWAAPYLKGWVAVAANVLLTTAGILMSVQPGQLWTGATLQSILIAVLMSAGIQGTVSKVILNPKPQPERTL